MSLLLRSNKTASPFLFWRKRSTKIEPTPPQPPLRIKVMNRSESDVFYASYSSSCPSDKSLDCSASTNTANVDKLSTSQVSTLTDSNKENESTAEPGEAQATEYEQSEDSVEVPIEQAELLLDTQLEREQSTCTVKATTTTMPVATEQPAPVAVPTAPETPDLARVPSNLEILEDLRNKLLSEKLKRRVAELAVSPTSATNESKVEPDDSLVKPPKKPPTKSFIEYRRDLFKCSSDKYTESDPPGQLVPGETVKKDDGNHYDEDDIFTLLGSESIDRSNFGVKRPDPDDSPSVMEEYPKPKIPQVPVEAKSGEDVAMHEILTAINMFVAPEYDIQKTPQIPESDSMIATMDTFSDCFGANGLPSSAKSSVSEPEGQKMLAEATRSSDSDDDDETPPLTHAKGTEMKPPLDVKFSNSSPVGVHELECKTNTPIRSRSMDFASRRSRDMERPRDEKTDVSVKFQLEPAGYTSLERHGSHDECSPLKRSGSEGLLNPREHGFKPKHEKEYGRSVRFHYKDTPVARKIDFGDEESKDEDMDDDESAVFDDADNERYRKHGQYVAFKEGKKNRSEKTKNDGPSVATNLQEVWYDCAYLFDVVSEEFWSGLLGDDDYDLASMNASTMDGNSLDGSVADSLYTEDDDQSMLNRKRQQMWRTYRRNLQLAKKEADV